MNEPMESGASSCFSARCEVSSSFCFVGSTGGNTNGLACILFHLVSNRLESSKTLAFTT